MIVFVVIQVGGIVYHVVRLCANRIILTYNLSRNHLVQVYTHYIRGVVVTHVLRYISVTTL